MILVSGATGQLGQSVVNHLLKRGAKGRFAVLARDLVKAKQYADQGIEIRHGDFDNPDSLTTAFADVERFLFVSTLSQNRGAQQTAVVAAARRAGIKHIVYTGLGIRNIATSAVQSLMGSHFETEDRIRESGMAWTFLRNTMYVEAIPQIVGGGALSTGIALSGGDGRVPYALRDEMGEAAANVLLSGHHSGKTYTLTGGTAWSYGDLAAALSGITGRQLGYQDIEQDDFRLQLIAMGLPDFMVWLTMGTVQDIRDGQYDIATRDLEHLLGRPPAALDAMLRSVFQLSR